MTKRILSLILSMFLLFTGSVAVAADDAVQPRYNYTSSTTVNISISSNTAHCTAQLIGYSSVDKIKITMTLQKKTVLWWSEVDTWTTTYYNSYALMTKDCSVGSGKYRVKAEFTVYSGSNSEEITSHSLECEN